MDTIARLAWYIRECSQKLQTALLTRASAFNELDPAKSKHSHATALQQLICAAAEDDHAKFLLFDSKMHGGWGIAETYNKFHFPIAKEGSNLEYLQELREIISFDPTNAPEVITSAIAGNPIPFYAMVFEMNLLPTDIKCAMVMLGLFNGEDDIDKNCMHRYVSGLFTSVIIEWVKSDPNNLIYVFRNYRRDLAHHMPRLYGTVIKRVKYPVIVLNYMIGWTAVVTPSFMSDLVLWTSKDSANIESCAEYYTEKTNQFRKRVVTWMLCGKMLRIHHDIRTMICDAVLDFCMRSGLFQERVLFDFCI
jgi:hypothetical protein